MSEEEDEHLEWQQVWAFSPCSMKSLFPHFG